MFCVENRVLLGFTSFCDRKYVLQGFIIFCVKNCVLLKFNHFLFKNAFGIHCRLRKTFFVLNWIFQYFVLKPLFYKVWHNFVSKTAFCQNIPISCLKMRLVSTVGWERFFWFSTGFFNILIWNQRLT